LKIVATGFSAYFSAVANRWTVKTEDLEFEVQYLKIAGYDTGNKRLANSIQIVTAKHVIAEFKGNMITLTTWDKLKKKSLYPDLYNPDMPRNLAKSVTVR